MARERLRQAVQPAGEHAAVLGTNKARLERLLNVLVAASAPVEISLRWRPLLRDPAQESWMARRTGSPWLRNDAWGG
jgi:hypothetical protein